MTNRITGVTPQKRNRQRVNVFIDGQFAFSLSLATAQALHSGVQLSDDEIEALKASDQKEQAFQQALFYLKFRPRSRMEMVRYLKRKQFVSAARDSAIERLQSYGYIDDAAFARFWIENRQRHRPRGAFGLRCELREKGVPDAIIDDGLEGYDEDAAAWRALANKLNRWTELEAFELRKKVHKFLKQRGFGYPACENAFERAKKRLSDG